MLLKGLQNIFDLDLKKKKIRWYSVTTNMKLKTFQRKLRLVLNTEMHCT